ncbi:MAG: hypothetical protein IKC65_07125 [Lentisphaeria bacterium]|nr:hypothetical protein [Lentisphaeria bacterium]
MSKFRTIVMFTVLAAVTCVLLVGVHRFEKRLDAQVAEYRLRFTGEIRNAPPMVIFTTVALGSFRGLVADLLWLRAGALQEKGNYFEMVQLARWITDLQPTFSGATAYLAWNMAYNISVTCSSFADRWRWVNEGIRLIRDQALYYNPEDPVIYKELAWIFSHKLGNILDDANLYYKNRLALQMASIVGEAGNPDWEKLAAAPESERAFLKKYKEDHVLWKAAQAAGFANYDMLFKAFEASAPELPKELTAQLGSDAKLKEELTCYFRAELLRKKLKLDAGRIVKLNKKYGMMDWRVPESQAIYWATLGAEKAPGGHDLSCDRIVTQSLYESFRAGRLMMIDEKNFESIIVVPNLALIDSVFNTFVEVQKYHDGEKNFYSTFRSARINFMKEAVTILYNYGKFSKAAEYYKKLEEEDGKQKEGSLEKFIMAQWAEDVRDAGVKKASEIISGLIFRSINYLVYNDHDAAVANERIARYIYKSYMSDMGDSDRTKLPPFNEMKKTVLENCIRVFPPAVVEILKAKIAAEQAESAIDDSLSGQRKRVK